MEEEKKEEITHHWDNEIGDTTCGYLDDGGSVADNLDVVNCERCLKIISKLKGKSMKKIEINISNMTENNIEMLEFHLNRMGMKYKVLNGN